MTPKKSFSFLLLLGLIFTASVGYAGDQVVLSTGQPNSYGSAEEDEFIRQDRNGDGGISQSEWFGSPNQFYRLDYDHNNFLTRDEYLSAGQGGVGQNYGPRDAFSAMDLDRNGGITSNEWTGSHEDFHGLDYNRDETLTRSEFFGRGSGYGGGYGGGGYGGRDKFSRQDLNQDGVLTQNEWRGRPRDFFRRDSNRDNVITRQEFFDGGYSGGGYSAGGNLRMSDMDRDGNNEIKPDEWPYDRASFDRLDTNRNNELSREEVEGSGGAQNSNEALGSLLQGILQQR